MSQEAAETRPVPAGALHAAEVPGSMAPLALAALGVVYGDIGTSPLYALKECFGSHLGVHPTHANVLGVLSLVFWSLTLVIVVKYLTFIMRADNAGEGGILALLALLRGDRARTSSLVTLGIFGAALLYGDGVITPAISVLSAIEGLQVATPVFAPFVVPLTVVILAALFFVQRRGTARVGSVFGPATLLWFASIAAVGLHWMASYPSVIAAIDPRYAIGFFVDNRLQGFLTLGSVVLCITGGEALYADMGHFGRKPIRAAWYAVVFPALLFSYFGQGALLLTRCAGAVESPSCRAAVENPFYSLVPESLLYPMVALATVATIVASQALISGAFSLTQQAVQLGYAPRVQIRHTSATAEGQIYVPFVNWALMVSCIALVTITGTSSRLAAAYGIAVTGTMAITSVLFYVVARRRWHWSLAKAGTLMAVFLAIDVAFFTANLAKLPQGGWIPIFLALGVYVCMSTWKQGANWRARELAKTRLKFEDFLTTLKADPPQRVKGTAVFMTQDAQGTPPALLHHLKHNQVLHEQVVILTIQTRNEPVVPRHRRVEISQLKHGFWRMLAHYGFMETPNVPEVMRLATQEGFAPRGRTSFYLGRETFVLGGRSGLSRFRAGLFALMARNARPPTDFFGIPPGDVVELGAQFQI